MERQPPLGRPFCSRAPVNWHQFNSATLGLHIWQRLWAPLDPATIERHNRPRLTSIGLHDLEVYPSPQRANHVHRLPFGLGYHTITDAGLPSDWVKQLEHFEAETDAPKFVSVARCLLQLVEHEWDCCERSGRFRPKRAGPFTFKIFLHRNRLQQEMGEVVAWVKSGCPLDEKEPQHEPSPVTTEKEAVHFLEPSHRSACDSISVTNKWSWADVKALALHGVPEEHKLYQFLLLLARPLIWRDYYHLNEADRLIKAEVDLMVWVLNKHNGRVTRVQDGRIRNIRHEVRRQVRVALEGTVSKLQDFYAEMRERDRLYRHRVELVSDLIRNKEPSTSLLGCCMCINKEEESCSKKGDMVGVPEQKNCVSSRIEPRIDDTPLPESVVATLHKVLKDKKMRRRVGEYPFVRFAKRLLNALWAEDGAAQINRDTLLAFCDSKNPNQQVGYKKIMAEYGLISDQWEGTFERGVTVATYQMTDEVFAQFQNHYGTAKTQKRVSGRFVITASVEAELNSVEWGW